MADRKPAKAPLEVVPYPAPVLYQRAEEVAAEEIDDEMRSLFRKMLDTMYAYHGVGLAAPQVGISKRFFVANPDPGGVDDDDEDDAGDDSADGEGGGAEYVFINPVITRPDGSQIGEEGCLSIPGVRGKVDRADTLIVNALDENGQPFEMEAEGYFARIIQHETDHLDGKLFIDKISPAEKLIAEKQLKVLRLEWDERQNPPDEKPRLRRSPFGRRGESPAKKRRLKRR